MLVACVDRIIVPMHDSYNSSIVIDGVITDKPGPYTVKLSSASSIEDSRPMGIPFSAKQVTISDNAGNSEVMTQVEPGTYQTNATGIRGVVGREYFVKVETLDGKIIESIPDKLNPVGAVDSVYYEFESHQPASAPTEYGYRIFVDAHDSNEGEHFIRWAFVGTYIVETKPQYKLCLVRACEPGALYCPLDCSGYAYVEGGELKRGYGYNPATQKVEYMGLECTCCRCWVTPRELEPRVNDKEITSNGLYRKVEVGYVPVNYYTFYEKYRVQVQQMSLSKNAFNYWKAVSAQKKATGSLFQPISGKIPTNLIESSKTLTVGGLFYASAIHKRQIYLDRYTNKVDLSRIPRDCFNREGPMGESCLLGFQGSYSTNQQPADWK
jgi:hypothetical protein